jgi:hypothetical protein
MILSLSLSLILHCANRIFQLGIELISLSWLDIQPSAYAHSAARVHLCAVFGTETRFPGDQGRFNRCVARNRVCASI